MDRRQAMRAAGILMAQAALGNSATAQDFGAILEDFGKDLLRQQLSPENIRRTLKPHLTGETVPIQTADGWTLVAHRFRPSNGPRAGTMPVILCHGLSYNAQFWDISPEVSLARYLAERGWETWVVNLRGSGLSSKWVAKLDAAPTMVVGGLIRRATNNQIAPTGYATLDPKFAKWNLDDHINYDVPALVHLVRSHTRAPEVAWIGHSMGGIIALCHLARFQNPGIGRLVTVGSQVTMPNGQLAAQFLTELMALRNGQIAGEILPEELLIDSKTSIDNMFFNQGHVSPQVYRALTHDGIDVPSIGLLRQYLVLATRKELLDAGKTFSYASMLPNVQAPILVSCGSADQLAPPGVQQTIYERVGSTDKTLLYFGRSMGFAADSGHSDALVGHTSRQQVYPTIERWLLGAR